MLISLLFVENQHKIYIQPILESKGNHVKRLIVIYGLIDVQAEKNGHCDHRSPKKEDCTRVVVDYSDGASRFFFSILALAFYNEQDQEGTTNIRRRIPPLSRRLLQPLQRRCWFYLIMMK